MSKNLNVISRLSTHKEQTQTFISDLYQIFLDRTPDHHGLKQKTNLLLDGVMTPSQAVETLFNSPEGKACQFQKIWRNRNTKYCLDIIDDPELNNKLFHKTASYWRNAGVNKNEVYFSVIAAPALRKEQTESEIQQFYISGREFIEFCLDILNEQGISTPGDLVSLDFGGGVGRLSFHASKYFKEVVAVDFSKGHLNLLKENMKKYPHLHRNNIECVCLKDLLDLNRLPSVDFIFSFISLQHNTPPVIAHIVKTLLQKLKSGGLACLHIPIHHPFYNFSVDNYLSSSRSGQAMEMHILPKENLRAIAKGTNATIVDSYGYGGTKGIYSEVFVFKKG